MSLILLGNAGAGKSTMTRRLIGNADIPRLSLDEIAWDRGAQRKRPARQATAIALMSIGTLAAVPYLVKLTLGCFNRADSERGSRNRLRSIRDSSGYHSETDAY